MQTTSLTAAAALLLALAGCAAPPSDHQDVAALMHDPKAIAFMLATPPEKAAILRSHFTRYAERPGLTEAQRTACLGMAASVTEVAFGPRDTPEWQAWAMHDGGEIEVVKAAFGVDVETAHEVLYSLD